MKNKLKKHKEESRILETKADKIIFGISVALYAIVMLIEVNLTPMHTTISSSIAAFGVSAFLISKALHIKKTRPTVLSKDKFKLLAMLAIAVFLTISGGYWLLHRFVL